MISHGYISLCLQKQNKNIHTLVIHCVCVLSLVGYSVRWFLSSLNIITTVQLLKDVSIQRLVTEETRRVQKCGWMIMNAISGYGWLCNKNKTNDVIGSLSQSGSLRIVLCPAQPRHRSYTFAL